MAISPEQAKSIRDAEAALAAEKAGQARAASGLSQVSQTPGYVQPPTGPQPTPQAMERVSPPEQRPASARAAPSGFVTPTQGIGPQPRAGFVAPTQGVGPQPRAGFVAPTQGVGPQPRAGFVTPTQGIGPQPRAGFVAPTQGVGPQPRGGFVQPGNMGPQQPFAPNSGPQPRTPPNSGPQQPFAPNSGPQPRTPPNSGPQQPFAPNSGPQRPTKAFRAGQMAGKGLKVVAPLAKAAGTAGVIANFNDYKIDDPEVDSSAAGTLRYLADGEFGKMADSLSKGAVETLSDLGSFAANTADVFVPGEPFSARYNRSMREQFGSQLVDKSGNGPKLPGALQANPAVTAAMPRAIQAATRGTPLAAPTQPAAAANVVTVKNGNDFSGSNVKEGFSYEGQLRRMPGDPIGSVPAAGITAALNGGGGGFSSTLPRSNDAIFGDMEQRGIEQRRLEGLVAEQRAASARPAPPMSLNDALLRLPTRSISEDLRAKTDGTYGAIQAADIKARGDVIKEFTGADAQRYGSELRAQSDRENAAVNDRNGLRNFQASVYTADQQGRAATAKNRMDAFYKEREFLTNQENKSFEQRQARESQLQKKLEATATFTGPDGSAQVDANKVARYRQGMDRAVARLGLEGVHQLSDRAEQQLIAGSDLLEQVQANAGLLPWKPDMLATVDPLDLTNLYVRKNGDRVITREGRAQGQIIPKRFFDTVEANHIRMFGTPTNKYDILNGEAEK